MQPDTDDVCSGDCCALAYSPGALVPLLFNGGVIRPTEG